MKPKLFMFIGLAMIGISLIILFVFIANPSTSLVRTAKEQQSLQYQKCVDVYTKLFDMYEDNRLNETEKLTLTTVCDRVYTAYDVTDTTTLLLKSLGGWLLIIGVPVTISGAIWLLVSKVKERRRISERGVP